MEKAARNKLLLRLLITQRGHRVHFRRAPCRNTTRQQRDDCGHHRDHDERCRFGCADPKEQTPNQPDSM